MEPCVLLYLASFTQHDASEVHPCCISTSFPFIGEKHSIVWIGHALFIRSPADEHLGHFHFSAIMNKAAVSIRVQAFVWT